MDLRENSIFNIPNFTFTIPIDSNHHQPHNPYSYSNSSNPFQQSTNKTHESTYSFHPQIQDISIKT